MKLNGDCGAANVGGKPAFGRRWQAYIKSRLEKGGCRQE
jgi:hypothetical protein